MISIDEEQFRLELRRIEGAIGYEFKNRSLLVQALTHKSYANESGGKEADNERLEFLGDAVLELIVSTQLFNAFPEEGEGRLSRGRAAIVRSTTLTEVATLLDLGKVIRLGRGEATTGGRRKPSVLSDCVEALFGAVYLDGGFEAARQVALKLLGRFFESPSWLFAQDPRSQLQDLLQQRGLDTPRYRLVEANGPQHSRTFVMEVVSGQETLGRGSGRSKKEAACNAAREALDVLSSEK